MDIILAVAILVWFYFMPYLGGFLFFFSGFKVLVDFDEEYDDKKKKRSAILDIILGTALLLVCNLFFWLVVYPFGVFAFKLNLPVFASWI